MMTNTLINTESQESDAVSHLRALIAKVYTGADVLEPGGRSGTL